LNETSLSRTEAASIQWDGVEFADFTDKLGVNHLFYIDSAWFKITNSSTLNDGDKCSLTGYLYWYGEDIKFSKRVLQTLWFTGLTLGMTMLQRQTVLQ